MDSQISSDSRIFTYCKQKFYAMKKWQLLFYALQTDFWASEKPLRMILVTFANQFNNQPRRAIMGNNLGKYQMRKRSLLAICAGIFAVTLLFTSCGGSEDGSKEKNVKFQKMPKNEYLGDLVNISCENIARVSASEAQYEEERAKNNEKYADNPDKRMQNWEKIKAAKDERNKKIMEEINANLDKELPALIGKTIPLEVEEGLGFEVMDCKITKIEKFRSPSRAPMTFTFSYKVIPVDPKKMDTYPGTYRCLDANGNILLDEAGNPIGDVMGLSRDQLKQLWNGETVENEGWLRIHPSMSNFAKIKIVKE